MLMAPFYVCKMVGIHQKKKPLNYIFIFKFSIYWIRFIYQRFLKFLKINLMLKLFMGLRLKSLELFFLNLF